MRAPLPRFGSVRSVVAARPGWPGRGQTRSVPGSPAPERPAGGRRARREYRTERKRGRNGPAFAGAGVALRWEDPAGQDSPHFGPVCGGPVRAAPLPDGSRRSQGRREGLAFLVAAHWLGPVPAGRATPDVADVRSARRSCRRARRTARYVVQRGASLGLDCGQVATKLGTPAVDRGLAVRSWRADNRRRREPLPLAGRLAEVIGLLPDGTSSVDCRRGSRAARLRP
jgi:hypothetical protein